MTNNWRLLVMSAAAAMSVVVSAEPCKELYHSLGPKISPCKKEIILQKGQNYTLTCRANTFIKFMKQEGQEESFGDFNIVNRSDTYENTEYKYEVTLDLIHVDRYAIGYYACVDASVREDLLNLLTEEPSNTEFVSYIYIYVNGTDSLFAPMLEMVTGKCDYYVVECRPSTPDVVVKLLMADIPENTYKRYSPTIGFIFDRESIEALAEPYAMFTCRFVHRYGIVQDVERFYVKQQNDQPPPTVSKGYHEFLQGETFSINCTVSYTQNLATNLFWDYPPNAKVTITSNNNENVGELIYSNILVVDATREHNGTYTCISKSHCATKNASFTKIFLEKSELSLSPITAGMNKINETFIQHISRTGISGFNVRVKSYPPPTCILVRNGVVLPSNYTFEYGFENNQCKFKLRKRSIEDTGNYTMKVTNGNETKSVTYELLFTATPTIKDVANHTCLLNTITSVECEVTGYPLPVVTWLFDGSEIPSSPNNMKEVSTLYKKRAILQLKCVASGALTCHAQNTFPGDTLVHEKSNTRWVFVDEVTHGFGIKYNETEEKDIWVTEAQADVPIKCLASRYKYSNVTWLLDDYSMDGRINVDYWSNNFSLVAKLNIRPIAVNHSGIYTCRGIRLDGTEENDTISVNVAALQSPKILFRTNFDENVEKNQHIEIGCQAQGVPLPEIQWLKDGEPLEKTNIITYYKNINRTTVNSSIEIEHVQDENRGKYECIAISISGKAREGVDLDFKEISSIPIAYIIIIAIILVIFFVMLIYLTCKVKKEKQFRKELAAAGLLNFKKGVTKSINPEIGIDEQAELLPYDEKFEFPPDKLVYGKQLGAGAFGVVYKAEARGIINAEETTPVAVKMVKKTADNMYIKALASELKIMVHLGKHINIVNLLGACTKNVGKRELVVIVEYCKFGNIHNYMQRHREVFIDQFSDNNKENNFGRVNRGYDTSGSTGLQSDYGTANTLETVLTNNTNRTCRKNVRKQPKEVDKVSEGYVQAQPEWRSNYESDYSYDGRSPRPLTSRDLLAWAFQVARGMEYLASRKVLHGDLAARNILLADDNIVKICDFGLARSIYKNDEYQKKENSLLPMKWLAIECMTDRIFSTQSDVWSFGIVLWEMFSLAKTPYPNFSPPDLLRFLTDGNRLSKPAYADDRIYDLMKRCWEQKPTARPSFTQLQEILGSYLEDNVRSHLVDLNATYMDENMKVEGQEDYLAMIRAPDYNNLVTPSPHHYVNETNQFFPPSPAKVDEDGYLQMSPANSHSIFSPKSTNTKFDFDPKKFNARPSEASNGGSELTPMLSLNNLQRSGSDSDHEGYVTPQLNTIPKIEEEDEVFEVTKQFNAKNMLNGAVTNPTYITLDTDVKKTALDSNNYVNIVPNGLVK